MTDKVWDDVLANEAVHQFMGEAKSYCLLMESHQQLTLDAFARLTVRLLPALYQSALLLPQTATERAATDFDEDVPTGIRVSLEIGQKLASYQLYRSVPSPLNLASQETTIASLADDLADIYADLKAGLATLERGGLDAFAEAVAHWRFTFGVHWGTHVVNALRVLHEFVFNEIHD